MQRPSFHRPEALKPHRSKSGQALLETFGIMMLLCMILFGMIQYVLMLTATEVIQYSADASVRARAVGFNDFMVYKVNRVASIPNAGLMTSPSSAGISNAQTQNWDTLSAGEAFRRSIAQNPSSSQYQNIEYNNIPLYMDAEHWGQLGGILDYEDWDSISRPIYTTTSGDTVGVTVTQDYPLRMPFLRAFTDGNEIHIRQEARLADHSELYLQ
ncbi:pilus assembly protein [Kiritimatiellota bacterium B12222]|nr:pilus assembly protein [Kiritimatiellota bacterium B12222]